MHIDELRTMKMDPGTVENVSGVVEFFKEKIDEDCIDNYKIIQEVHKTLNNNQKLAVNNQLGMKAPNSNKLYRRLLREYLCYQNYEDNDLHDMGVLGEIDWKD